MWYHYKGKMCRSSRIEYSSSRDNLSLDSGVVILNCPSPTAIKTLKYWEISFKRTNNWQNVPSNMHEQNAIQANGCYIQTPWWHNNRAPITNEPTS